MTSAFTDFFIARGYAVLRSPMQTGLIAPYLRPCIVRTPQALIEQMRREQPSSKLSVAQEIMMGISRFPQEDDARQTMSHQETMALYRHLKASAASPDDYIAGAMWRHREIESTAVTSGDDSIRIARLNIHVLDLSELVETLTHNSSLFEIGILDHEKYRFISAGVLNAGLQVFRKRPSQMARIPELALEVIKKKPAR